MLSPRKDNISCVHVCVWAWVVCVFTSLHDVVCDQKGAPINNVIAKRPVIAVIEVDGERLALIMQQCVT